MVDFFTSTKLPMWTRSPSLGFRSDARKRSDRRAAADAGLVDQLLASISAPSPTVTSRKTQFGPMRTRFAERHVALEHHVDVDEAVAPGRHPAAHVERAGSASVTPSRISASAWRALIESLQLRPAARGR